jgi:hypothetical protein
MPPHECPRTANAVDWGSKRAVGDATASKLSVSSMATTSVERSIA